MDESALLRATPDESGLVAAARGGDGRAFRILVERHYRRIYRFLLKHAVSAAEAEELTQDVFLQAHLGIAQFRGQSRFETWLTGIALNIMRNYTRRSPWRINETEMSGEDEVRQITAPAGDPQHCACRNAALDAIALGLGRLPLDMRECLMLVAVEGLPYEEAAAVLGEPVGSVKSRVSRARQLLRRHVDPWHLKALAGQT